MKKSLKIIFILIISYIFSLPISYANQIDFYWEKDSSWNINETSINEHLDNFYKQTWINTDIIILWKWNDCYLENNFDSCIQEQENYSSDLLIVLSMKSDIKSDWDFRSLTDDDYNEIISTSELKNIWDQITKYLANWDYNSWINKYLEIFWTLINSKCIEVWLWNDCKIDKLAKEYKNYIAEQSYKKQYYTMMYLLFIILIFLTIIFIYKIIKKQYIKKINNLYKDFSYLKKNIWTYEIFSKDKEKIENQIDIIIESIANKLWDLDKNIFYLKKYYKSEKEKIKQIEELIQQMKKTYLKKEEIKEKVEKMKGIDL